MRRYFRLSIVPLLFGLAVLAVPYELLADEVQDLRVSARKMATAGNVDKAVEIFKSAIKRAGELYGADSKKLIGPISELARLYQRGKTYANAIPLLERTLEIREKAFGKASSSLVFNLEQLGALHLQMEAYAPAQPIFLRAIKILKSGAKPPSAKLIPLSAKIGTIYFALEDYEKGEIVYRDAIATLEKSTGFKSVKDALILLKLAAAQFNQGHFTNSKKSHKKFKKTLETLGRPTERINFNHLYNRFPLKAAKDGNFVQIAAKESEIVFRHRSFLDTPIVSAVRNDPGLGVDDVSIYRGLGSISEIILGQSNQNVQIDLDTKQTAKEALSTWKFSTSPDLIWQQEGVSEASFVPVPWQRFTLKNRNCFSFSRSFAPKRRGSDSKFLKGYFCYRTGKELPKSEIDKYFANLGVRGYAAPLVR